MQQFATGTQDGTGAAISIECGFKPDHVVVQNIEAADAARVEWFKGMTAGHGIKALGTATPARAVLTSLGITPSDGDEDTEAGFTIGADADLNVAGEALTWVAFRNA